MATPAAEPPAADDAGAAVLAEAGPGAGTFTAATGAQPAASAATSTALVVYSYAAASLGDALALPERCFAVAGRTLRLRQGWRPDGRGGTGLGFGAAVYPSAIVLSHFLECTFADRLRGRRVVELGAGVGLCALAAALVGAGRVVATDGDATSVALCADNVARHGLGAAVTCRKLLWGDAGDTAAAVAACGGAVDVVLGADVAACPYAAALPQLVETMVALCRTGRANNRDASAGGGSGDGTGTVGSDEAEAAVVLLAYKTRQASEEAFWAAARRQFRVVSAPRAAIHPDFRDDASQRLAILTLLPPDAVGE